MCICGNCSRYQTWTENGDIFESECHFRVGPGRSLSSGPGRRFGIAAPEHEDISVKVLDIELKKAMLPDDFEWSRDNPGSAVQKFLMQSAKLVGLL